MLSVKALWFLMILIRLSDSKVIIIVYEEYERCLDSEEEAEQLDFSDLHIIAKSIFKWIRQDPERYYCSRAALLIWRTIHRKQVAPGYNVPKDPIFLQINSESFGALVFHYFQNGT